MVCRATPCLILAEICFVAVVGARIRLIRRKIKISSATLKCFEKNIHVDEQLKNHFINTLGIDKDNAEFLLAKWEKKLDLASDTLKHMPRHISPLNLEKAMIISQQQNELRENKAKKKKTTKKATTAPKADATKKAPVQVKNEPIDDEPPLPEPPPAPQEEKIVPQNMGTTPFDKWPEVLDRVFSQDKSLIAMLTGSSAFIHQDKYLLIKGSPVLEMYLKTGDYSKTIKEAVTQITGKSYTLAVYNNKQEQAPKNPLSDLVSKARNLGVKIEEE